MTTYLLIRHATADSPGNVLNGRNSGIHLSDRGLKEAEELSRSLQDQPIEAIYSSPLERTLETAAPLARRLQLPVQRCENLNEIDFGMWSGRTYEELRPIPEWKRFNELRSLTAPPGGESMLHVQERAVMLLENLRQIHPRQTVALFSHADVIRAMLVHLLGCPLDLFQRFEVSPASVSVAAISHDTVKVLKVNQPVCHAS